MNSFDYLEKIKIKIFENLKDTTFAPSVEMQDVPKGFGMTDEDEDMLDDLDEDENTDVRYTDRKADRRIEASGELSDSDDESGETSHRKGKAQRNTMNHGDSRVPSAHTSTLSDVDERLTLFSPSASGSPKSVAIESRDEDIEMGDAHMAGTPPGEIPELFQRHLSSPSDSEAEPSRGISPTMAVQTATPARELIGSISPLPAKQSDAVDINTAEKVEPEKPVIAQENKTKESTPTQSVVERATKEDRSAAE